MIEAIVLVLKLIFGVFSFMSENRTQKRRKKKEALKEILDGVEKKDPSAVTAGFDNLNRV